MGPWFQHIDGVILVALGALFSLMGAGILKVSKATNQQDERILKTRRNLSIGGPLLILFGLFRIVFPTTQVQGSHDVNLDKGWQEVKGDGKFSVLLPGPPEVKERLLDSPLGKVTLHSFSVVADPMATDYRIRYTDLPSPASYENAPQPLEPDLAGFRDFKLRAKSATIVSGYPATIVDGSWPNGLSVKLEFVWVGPRQYVLMRTANPGVAPADDKFFSSFRVIAK
jgi:hypothetical protein